MAALVNRSKLIAVGPALVRVIDQDLADYLNGLSPADFLTVADTKAEWAVEVADAGSGTAEASADGTAWVVSGEVYKRAVKGHRF